MSNKIKIYSDTSKGCILFDGSTVQPKFLGTILAEAHPTLTDRIVVFRTDRQRPDGTNRKLFKKLKITRIQNEAGQDLVDDLAFTRTDIVNYVNTQANTSGGQSSGQVPNITSATTLALTTGDTLNYELTADYGVGYEWAGLPTGLVTVDGNVRKLIGGSALTEGQYTFDATAVNYFGTDTETITLNVSNPPFQDSKSVKFENGQNQYLGANAALGTSLERSGNSSGTAWSISFWIKPANNATGQTLFYFGSNDVTNNGFIEIRQVQTSRIRLRYGSNNNYVQCTSPASSLTAGSWNHVVVTYDGGTTGASQSNLTQYYNRFAIYINGSVQSRSNAHNNYGYTGSIVGQNFRWGRFSSGNHIRGGFIDEASIHASELSASDITSIYNNGSPRDLANFSPVHWWRMGDGDTFSTIQDNVGTADMVMYNMTAANIVTDVP